VILVSIEISNYRSIKNITIPIEQLSDRTFTYGLIGVNEAGKSSILKAISLKDGAILLSPKDFRDNKNPVVISFTYQVPDNVERDAYLQWIAQAEPDITKLSALNHLIITHSFEYESRTKITTFNTKRADGDYLELHLDGCLPNAFHNSIFWTAEDKYLISHPINLTSFAANPDEVSVPLRNCFSLAGIKNIKERIDQLADDSTEVEQLQTELGERVTDHIKTVWPGHPIKITFLITNGLINFHVKDTDSGGKAKTADQRSDGFKQFVSFLLTISAQNKNDQLSNSLLLLDEPETHLHPQAQEYLLAEIKKISKNDRNNIVIFATHSNFMIDKEDLSRNFRTTKDLEATKIERFSKNASSYSGVNFEVFGISSSDYHSELYSKLHLQYQLHDQEDQQRLQIQSFDDGFFYTLHNQKQNRPSKKKINRVTLSTYIRNCIHHSDNGDRYTADELFKSIKIMRSVE
jgi:predicted ATP-dependent endonuclease of OLD family